MQSIRMIRSLWPAAGIAAGLLVAGMAAPVAAQDDEEAEASVRPVGLRIVGPAYGEEDGLRPFNWTRGTAVVLLVERPAGGLIALDAARSTLEAFTDSEGEDLLGGGGRGFGGRFGGPLSSTLSEDGKAAMVEIEGGGLPGEGARAVRAAGTFILRIGSRTETHRQAGVPVAEGTEIEDAGPIPFTVGEVGEPRFGDAPLAITLRAERDLDEVAAIRFLDADGEEIESRLTGRGRMGFGDRVTVERTYWLEREADALTVEIDYWADMETVELPFEVDATIGGWR